MSKSLKRIVVTEKYNKILRLFYDDENVNERFYVVRSIVYNKLIKELRISFRIRSRTF